MALAMQVPKTRGSNTFTLRPHAATQASQPGRHQVTVTDEADLTWGLGTKVWDSLSLIGIIAVRVRSAGLKHSPTVCGILSVGTSSENTIVTGSDIHEEIAGIFSSCACENAVQQTAATAREVAATAELPSYPVAEFIRPTAYVWDEDLFAAEEAVRTYLKDSHADH